MIREFVDTEDSYQRYLDMIVTKFLVPTRSQKLLPLLEMGDIFCNVEILAMSNVDLSKSLRETFQQAQAASTSPDSYPDVSIGPIFLSHVRELIPIYTPYCLNQTKSVATFERVSASKKFSGFSKLLTESMNDPACENLPLMSFLIKPVQRLCKYPLLLRELLKCTPDAHPDRESLSIAMTLTQSLVDQVNTSKREAENVRNMLSVTSQLSGADNLKLMMPGRRFLMEASMVKISVHNKHQTRQFFLFNDLLIYAAKAPIGKKYVFKGFYYMNQIELVDVPDTDSLKNAFCLIRQDSIKKKHVIYTDTPKEKMEWIKAISQCIVECSPRTSVGVPSSSSEGRSGPSTSEGGVAFRLVSTSKIDAQQQLQMVDVENRVDGWENDKPGRRYLRLECGPFDCTFSADGKRTTEFKRWMFIFNDSVMFTSKQSDKSYQMKHFFKANSLKIRTDFDGLIEFSHAELEVPLTVYLPRVAEKEEISKLLLNVGCLPPLWAEVSVVLAGVIRVNVTNPALVAFGHTEKFYKSLRFDKNTTIHDLEEDLIKKLAVGNSLDAIRAACQDYSFYHGETPLQPADIISGSNFVELEYKR